MKQMIILLFVLLFANVSLAGQLELSSSQKVCNSNKAVNILQNVARVKIVQHLVEQNNLSKGMASSAAGVAKEFDVNFDGCYYAIIDELVVFQEYDDYDEEFYEVERRIIVMFEYDQKTNFWNFYDLEVQTI